MVVVSCEHGGLPLFAPHAALAIPLPPMTAQRAPVRTRRRADPFGLVTPRFCPTVPGTLDLKWPEPGSSPRDRCAKRWSAGVGLLCRGLAPAVGGGLRRVRHGQGTPTPVAYPAHRRN